MKPPDIIITPTRPISANWNIQGATDIGIAYINRLYPSHVIRGGRDLRAFKTVASAAGLTYKTNWDCVVLERVDP